MFSTCKLLESDHKKLLLNLFLKHLGEKILKYHCKYYKILIKLYQIVYNFIFDFKIFFLIYSKFIFNLYLLYLLYIYNIIKRNFMILFKRFRIIYNF